MSNKEISSILNITQQSAKNARYRLKTKLSLDNDISIRKFINDL